MSNQNKSNKEKKEPDFAEEVGNFFGGLEKSLSSLVNSAVKEAEGNLKNILKNPSGMFDDLFKDGPFNDVFKDKGTSSQEKENPDATKKKKD